MVGDGQTTLIFSHPWHYPRTAHFDGDNKPPPQPQIWQCRFRLFRKRSTQEQSDFCRLLSGQGDNGRKRQFWNPRECHDWNRYRPVKLVLAAKPHGLHVGEASPFLAWTGKSRQLLTVAAMVPGRDRTATVPCGQRSALMHQNQAFISGPERG